jgi:hypothetical protein
VTLESDSLYTLEIESTKESGGSVTCHKRSTIGNVMVKTG